MAKAAAGKGLSALDKLWKARDEKGSAEKLIEGLSAACADDPKGYEAHWKLARACWWLSDMSEDTGKKKQLGEQGKEAGRKAWQLEEGSAEGHIWFAAALGEYGLGISIAKAIWQGLDGEFRKHAERAIALDKAYDGPAPLRALGRFYSKLPWPKQDLKKSEQLLREAIETAPERLLTRLYLAETLDALGRKDEAKKEIDALLKLKAKPDEAADEAEYKRRAKAALARLK